MIKCINFMDLERIRETVSEYEKMWGHPDEPPREILGCSNCVKCDHGFDSPWTKLAQALDPDNDIMEALKKATGGKPFRICFKEFKE